MTGIEIYLLSLIPALKDVLIGMGFLGILACIGAAIYTLHNDGYNEEDERKTGKRICKKALTCAIICFVLSCFIPDRKTIMAMYVVPAITEYKVIKELPDNLQKVIDKFVKDYVGEGK